MSSTAGTTAELIRLQTSFACELPVNEPKSTCQPSLALEARKRCTDMAVSQDACSKGGTDDSKYAADPPTYSGKGPEMYYLSGLRGDMLRKRIERKFCELPSKFEENMESGTESTAHFRIARIGAQAQ